MKIELGGFTAKGGETAKCKMTDPISSMLIMIKNAGNASRETVVVPHSKIKQAIANCLLKNEYIKSVTKKVSKDFPVLEIGVAFRDDKPRINDVKRISKPSKRIYAGVKEIKPFKNGYGIYVLSTPKGIMTDKEAKKEMVGGELLFSIW